MWPVVMIEGRRYNLWEINGEIGDRFVRWIRREPPFLAVENAWFTGERKVVKETVELNVPTPGVLDLALSVEAVGESIAIQGTPDENKGYGGLCLRFAPRKATVIRTDKGEEPQDTNMVPHPWAELEGAFAGGRAGARIDDDPSNPGYPNGWCLRRYGFLGVNFPGLQPYTLEPGTPLRLRYRITVFGRGA
jgi:hypothetical protein